MTEEKTSDRKGENSEKDCREIYSKKEVDR
jgi:hypothetical protein